VSLGDLSAAHRYTTGLHLPGEITLDATKGKMYWADAGTHKIRRANLDGSGLEDLVTRELSTPWALALDVAGGKMYWTDAGTGKIQRANLDGSGVEDLVMTYSSGPAGGGGKRYGLALELGK